MISINNQNATTNNKEIKRKINTGVTWFDVKSLLPREIHTLSLFNTNGEFKLEQATITQENRMRIWTRISKHELILATGMRILFFPNWSTLLTLSIFIADWKTIVWLFSSLSYLYQSKSTVQIKRRNPLLSQSSDRWLVKSNSFNKLSAAQVRSFSRSLSQQKIIRINNIKILFVNG